MHGQAISYTWSVSQQPCFDWCSHSRTFFFIFLPCTDDCYKSCSEAHKKLATPCIAKVECAIELTIEFSSFYVDFVSTRYGNDCDSVNLGQICCVGSKITLQCMTFSSSWFVTTISVYQPEFTWRSFKLLWNDTHTHTGRERARFVFKMLDQIFIFPLSFVKTYLFMEQSWAETTNCTDQITRTRILLFNWSHVFFISLHLAFNDICFFLLCDLHGKLSANNNNNDRLWCHFYVFQLFCLTVSTGIQNWHVFLIIAVKCHEWTSWLFSLIYVAIAYIHNRNA